MEKEQIVNALELCSNDECSGCECPYYSLNTTGCIEDLHKDALSIILEQDKRIEELTEENKKYREMVGSLAAKDGEVVGITVGKEVRYIEKGIADVFKNMAVAKAKADTVRKMQEAIKERCLKGGIYPVFVKNAIDNVASELLEKKDG